MVVKCAIRLAQHGFWCWLYWRIEKLPWFEETSIRSRSSFKQGLSTQCGTLEDLLVRGVLRAMGRLGDWRLELEVCQGVVEPLPFMGALASLSLRGLRGGHNTRWYLIFNILVMEAELAFGSSSKPPPRTMNTDTNMDSGTRHDNSNYMWPRIGGGHWKHMYIW